MTGERLYEIQWNCARVFGEQLPTWQLLSAAERDDWDCRAYEQEKRDRVTRSN